MTSRDHLLGQPAAGGPEWGDDDFNFGWADLYPLGVPDRVVTAAEQYKLKHWSAPTLAELLPTGNHQCTSGDNAGIGRRPDISKTRIREAVAALGAQMDQLRGSRATILCIPTDYIVNQDKWADT